MSVLKLSNTASRNFHIAARQSSTLFRRSPAYLIAAPPVHGSRGPINTINKLVIPATQGQREYSSSSKGFATGWLKRRIYALLAVLGVSGGALILVYSKMQSTVGQLSWVENLYPSSVAERMSKGLGSLSEWLKTPKEIKTTTSRVGDSDSTIPSTDRGHVTTSQSSSVSAAKDRLLTSEIRELQTKLQSADKENYKLRQELAKLSGIDPSRIRGGRKQTLIEMYTDILNLLTEFDAKSNRKDGKFINTLPQVVVVGDQSAGKTSVLEMVANARIFPRGGGEMMTRSPVMVTLSDGPEHVATFHGSNKVYDLSKEQDLKSLRKEIEVQMKAHVQSGKTVSTQPISLTVYGPHLKRMVLVDLPGIISTVTTGMAASTREEIIGLCRQYMQNPNAIIMCIQDGSVDAERSIVTDIVSQMDPEGDRTIFVLTKVDMAEKGGVKQDRMLSILDGQLFPMKAIGYYAVVTGKGNTGDNIDEIHRYERDYFARSKLFQNGMLRESQLSTRNMVSAVTEEFWRMVRGSINDQALHFKTLRYNLEAEWRNRYPGGRTLDRDDLFELGKADILNEVASLQVLPPAKWELILMDTLWDKMAPKVLDIFVVAEQGKSPGEFNTSADIQLHKWADSLELAKQCAEVGQETMFEMLHNKLEFTGEGGNNRFHSLSQGLREEIERLSRTEHQWEPYNIDQLKYVQMSTLDDKDVQSAEQWEAAVQFMTSSVKKQIKVAEDELNRIEGPTSYYDRWVRWRSQTDLEAKRQAIALELGTFLKAEPSHANKLYPDEILTVQRVLKNKGYAVSGEDVQYTWERVYNLHFLREAEQTASKCQWGFNLRHHSTEYTCSEVEFFWRVQQVMKSSARTLRVQILDREVRQLEQQVKATLDSIASDDTRKREVIRGDAVDKAEQLKQVRMIQEKLDAFKDALKNQQRE